MQGKHGKKGARFFNLFGAVRIFQIFYRFNAYFYTWRRGFCGLAFRACLFAGIPGIPVWKIPEFPDKVEFLNAPLDLSIQKFYQNA